MYGPHTHLGLGSISASEEDHVVLQVNAGHQPLPPHLAGPVCTGRVILVLREGEGGVEGGSGERERMEREGVREK